MSEEDLRKHFTELLIKLEHEMHNAPTAKARRAATVKYQKLSEQLRAGGYPTTGAEPDAVAVDPARYPNILLEAITAGEAAAQSVADQFPFGWSYLCTKDRSFARFLQRLTDRDKPLPAGYGPEFVQQVRTFISGGSRNKGYYRFFVHVPGKQTLPPEEAFCHAAADVLKHAGISAWCESAWD